MSNDARIMTSLPAHPKTKKLIRRHGQAAGWNLICLFLFARDNKPDGDFTGMTAEDIELAADWQGKDGEFIESLVDLGFLDEVDGGYLIHDWEDHNPWAAGAEMRSIKARWNAIKRHHGQDEADRRVPEYRAVRNASSNASSTDLAMRVAGSSNAPSPSPSPSPSPTPVALDTLPQPEPPATRTQAGHACLLMREAGCVTVNPGHPDLLAALAEGVTPEDLGHAAAEAVQLRKAKPFPWAIATARGRMEESRRRPVVPAHRQPNRQIGLADQVMEIFEENQRRKLAHERND